MKRIISIILLFIFLYNMVGYKAVFYMQMHQAETRINKKILNSEFPLNRLITIKIPLNLPYLMDWKDFETMEGEVVFNRKTYKYIKRKIERDSLVLVCIDHQEKSQIQKNSDDYFKKVNDLTADNNKKPVIKQAKNDFFEESNSYNFSNNYLFLQNELKIFKPEFLSSVCLDSEPKPPQC